MPIVIRTPPLAQLPSPAGSGKVSIRLLRPLQTKLVLVTSPESSTVLRFASIPDSMRVPPAMQLTPASSGVSLTSETPPFAPLQT